MKYVAFLKAVNVGGNKKVDMKQLVGIFNSKEMTNIKTYLNSGNLIFESSLKEGTLETVIYENIKDKMNVDTIVIVRSLDNLKAIIEKTPYHEDENDKSKQLVYFFTKKVNEKGYDKIKDNGKRVESYYPMVDHMYVYYFNGVGRSIMTTNYIDKALGVETTGRNMNTIESLIEKGDS